MIVSQHISLLSCLFILCFLEKIDAVIHSSPKSFLKNYKHSDPDFTIQTVSLTQKGYIQFLRYTTDVPPLRDYTFCIWIRSNNLTYSHPLLSYSRHEEERLIRVWVSPTGRDLNLEILDHPITTVPVYMVENHWYHICQSWSYQQAAWSLYLNGKLISSGSVPKLRGIPIKGGGDIVVGQEYTDFDKGLDDGIEGDVFGFNFVLSSTSGLSKYHTNPIKLANYPLRRYFDAGKRINPQLHAAETLNIYQPLPAQRFNFRPETEKQLIIVNNNRDFLNIKEGCSEADVPGVLGYFKVPPSRHPKGFLSFGRNIFQNTFDVFEPQVYHRRIVPYGEHYRKTLPNNHYIRERIMTNVAEKQKPLGMLLVELSLDCAFKKGAPLSGKRVLINWTKSPVRVFGGAILKNMLPFCRKIDF